MSRGVYKLLELSKGEEWELLATRQAVEAIIAASNVHRSYIIAATRGALKAGSMAHF